MQAAEKGARVAATSLPNSEPCGDMSESFVPNVVVNVCHNCIPQAQELPHQWRQGTSLIVLSELPCSGKLELRYLLHALEGVTGGVCIVACPLGHCRLGQGNHRARIRMATLHRLLAEIGIESDRAVLLHCTNEDTAGLEKSVRAAVDRILSLGPNPVHTAAAPEPARRMAGEPQTGRAGSCDGSAHRPRPIASDALPRSDHGTT